MRQHWIYVKLIETCWWITCADIELISQTHALLINNALWFYLTKYILSITIVWQVLGQATQKITRGIMEDIAFLGGYHLFDGLRYWRWGKSATDNTLHCLQGNKRGCLTLPCCCCWIFKMVTQWSVELVPDSLAASNPCSRMTTEALSEPLQLPTNTSCWNNRILREDLCIDSR